MDSKSDIIEKIKKLLALSKSQNQHEAELAARRASDLMAKYQIEAAVIEATSIKSGKERVGDVHFTVPDLRMKYQWVVTLGNAAATLFGGTVLINPSQLHGTGFTFVGFSSEIPLMQELFLHLYNSWKGFVERDLAAAKHDLLDERGAGATWEPRDTMRYKHGHGQGYANALQSRCAKLADERNRTLDAQNNDCRALVIVRGAEIEEFFKRNRIKRVSLKQTKGDQRGIHDGHKVGSAVALGGALKA